MKIVRRLGVTGVAVAMLCSTLTGRSAAASRPAKTTGNSLSEVQVGAKFLRVAYTWNKAWYNGGPSIGKRDKAYTDKTVDAILEKVYVGPDAMANESSWNVTAVDESRSKALPHGVRAYSFKIEINGYPLGGTPIVRIKSLSGTWRAVGTYLPAGEAENAAARQYCHGASAAASYCRIYPPGSD